MANNEDNFEDMYTSDSETSHQSRRQNKEAAKMAYNATKKAGGKALKIGTRLGKRAIIAALPYIAAIIGFILTVILLLTIMVYIFSGPDILRGQIVKLADDLFSAFSGLLTTVAVGEDYAAITEKQVLDVANYIQNMGYDLIGYGFVDSTEMNMLEKNSEGEITKISSSIISDYLAAENRTYMLSTISIRSLYNGAKGFLEGNDAASASIGMLNVSNDIDAVTEIVIDGKTIPYDQVAKDGNNGSGGTPVELSRKVEVDRETKKMTITLTETKLVNNQRKTTETKCVYNLEGWVGRYGKPVEFLLALHLGTMAPKFADAIATKPEFDAKVNIRLFKSVEVVRLKYNGMTLDETKEYINERIAAWWNYYQQYNAAAKKTVYTYQDAINKGQEVAGVTFKELEEAKTYQEAQTKEKYTPYIVNVENHWYKDLTFKNLNEASEDDAYVKTNPTTVRSKYNKFDVYTYSSGEIYQVAEPKKSDINKKFDELFTNGTWTIMNGTSSEPLKSTESELLDSANKTKIDPTGMNMQIVMTMLEKAEQKSDDAKYIVRDLKEYFETKGFKFKDSKILSPDGKVVDSSSSSGSSSGGSGSSSGSSSTGSTTDDVYRNKLDGLLGGKTASVLYSGNDAIIKTSEMNEGTKVQSIVGGTVEEISENAVQIKITSPASLKGKTLIMSGVSMDTGIQKGAKVSKNTPIAQTVKNTDIKIKLQDESKNSISVKDNL